MARPQLLQLLLLLNAAAKAATNTVSEELCSGDSEHSLTLLQERAAALHAASAASSRAVRAPTFPANPAKAVSTGTASAEATGGLTAATAANTSPPNETHGGPTVLEELDSLLDDIADGRWFPPARPKGVTAHLLWVLFPVPIILGVWWAQYLGGGMLMVKALPIGLSIVLILLVLDNQYVMPHLKEAHFSIGSAIVTMVVVMETGTVEAFFLKTVLRFAGTLFGAGIGYFCAWFSGQFENHPTLVLGTSFVFFTMVKATGKSHPKTAYFFTIASVTFALVFYTRSAAVGRFFSVLIGNAFAFFTTFVLLLGFADPYDATISSLAGLIENGHTIMDCTLQVVDLAFLELRLTCVDDTKDVQKAIQQIVTEHPASQKGKKKADTTEGKQLSKLYGIFEGSSSVEEMIKRVTEQARSKRTSKEATRYEAQFGTVRFRSDVELMRKLCCIHNKGVPDVAGLVESADKVFNHAVGLMFFVEMQMQLGCRVLDKADLDAVDAIRQKIQDVQPHFASVFCATIWLPRARWKAMLVLMAPGLFRKTVRNSLNQEAAVDAMASAGRVLTEADEELSTIWRAYLEREGARKASKRTSVLWHHSRKIRSNRQLHSSHFLYHALHVIIVELAALAEAVLELQQGSELESKEQLQRFNSAVACLQRLQLRVEDDADGDSDEGEAAS